MTLTKALERLYPHTPITAQNLMISGKGWALRRQRYGRVFRAAFAEAKLRTTWSADQLAAWQLEALRSFLAHAGNTSPYWRERFYEAGFDPSRLRDLAEFSTAPVLEKSDLRGRTGAIASNAVPSRGLVPVHTSGTTGTPISVAFTPEDTSRRMAILSRMLDSFGVAPMSRSARLSGRTLFPNATNTGVFWRMNWPMRQMLMSAYHLHPDNMQAYVDQLAHYRPELIDGYPSAIFVLARFINSTGESGRVTPRAVMTTAETLEDYQRKEIALAFGGCPVINQYASSEGAPFITEDPEGELVINTDTGVFEFVRPGTVEPALPGELAEMLVTSFTTHAYPLIRYRIGDTVMLPAVPRHSRVWDMPVVERILGRQEDILYTTERGYVGRLDPVFKKSPSTIIESQIVQTGPMSFVLRVVPDPRGGYDVIQLTGVQDELRLRLGSVEIVVEEVASLPRGANGKLRAVVGMGLAGQVSSH